jgi:putative endonuclease
VEAKPLGLLGEKITAIYLKRCNYRVVARNWYCHWGELDLICTHLNRGVVFVEVKTVSGPSTKRISPEEQFTYRKRAKLYRTINIYLSTRAHILDWAVDLVCIELTRAKALIRHYECVPLA